MKKNVFSKAIAVLASMTVLGAASMVSANAAGIAAGVVTVPYGTEGEVEIPLYPVDVESTGAQLTFAYDDALNFVEATGTLVAEGDTLIFANTTSTLNSESNPFGTLVFDVTGLEPGEYPITITGIQGLGDPDGNPAAEPWDAIAGAIVVEEAPDVPTDAPTEAPTDAPTEAATTAAPVAKASPKTGTAGVAVAVAGLVTAGATAVVLKKRH